MDPLTTIWTAIIAGLSVEGIKWLAHKLQKKLGNVPLPPDVDANAIDPTHSQGLSTLSNTEKAQLVISLLWEQRNYLLAEGFSKDEIYGMIADILENPEKYIEEAKTTPTNLEQLSYMIRFLNSLDLREDED